MPRIFVRFGLSAMLLLAALPPLRAADAWLTDLEAAKKQAAAEKKDILVDFTGSDWCVWCIRLKKEVFDQKAFEPAAKDFVFVELDFPRGKQQDPAVKAKNEALAKQFSIEVTLQIDHKLIQSGPYKVIRHPRYLGILVFFTGISLTFRSLLGIMLVMVLAAVLVWRVFAEEKMMHQEFGKEWEAYRAKTWRLIPYLF